MPLNTCDRCGHDITWDEIDYRWRQDQFCCLTCLTEILHGN